MWLLGLLKDLEVLRTLFLGHAGQQGEGRLVQHFRVHRHILFWQSPFCVRTRLPSKACLVDVYDSVAVVLGHGELSLHRGQQLFCFVWIIFFWRLVPSVLLLFDLVELIYFSEQGRVHHRRRKFFLEMLDPVLQRHGRLLPQCLSAGQPFDLMWQQESEAEVYPELGSLHSLHPFQQRQILDLGRLKSCHVQSPDLRAGHPKDLAENFIGDVRQMTCSIHKFAKLQLDQVVDLLLAELLHLIIIEPVTRNVVCILLLRRRVGT